LKRIKEFLGQVNPDFLRFSKGSGTSSKKRCFQLSKHRTINSWAYYFLSLEIHSMCSNFFLPRMVCCLMRELRWWRWLSAWSIFFLHVNFLSSISSRSNTVKLSSSKKLNGNAIWLSALSESYFCLISRDYLPGRMTVKRSEEHGSCPPWVALFFRFLMVSQWALLLELGVHEKLILRKFII
jgi:hypothetical protein